MEKNEKKCQVWLLPTDKETKMFLSDDKLNVSCMLQSRKSPNGVFMYITSDDEIKEGDWYCNLDMRTDEFGIIQCNTQRLSILATNAPSCRKVIATTNTSLRMYGEPIINGTATLKGLLPQPSESFIKVFINEYNKGNVIKEVMVEYISVQIPREMSNIHQFITVTKPLINPKDNTITIRKIKDSWTTKELIAFAKYSKSWVSPKTVEDAFNKWIEENL